MRTVRPDKRNEFEATALPFMKSLYGTALRLSRRPEDASDLVQETLLRALRTFQNFTVGTNAKAWLLTILYSVFVNKYRKDRRERLHVSMDEVREDALVRSSNQEAHELPGLDDVSDGAVGRALSQLGEDFRATVLLVDVEELSYEEAAAVLGCPLGTLRSRLFRARRVLFAELSEYARKAGYAKKV